VPLTVEGLQCNMKLHAAVCSVIVRLYVGNGSSLEYIKAETARHEPQSMTGRDSISCSLNKSLITARPADKCLTVLKN
jgi:hypothetical protein